MKEGENTATGLDGGLLPVRPFQRRQMSQCSSRRDPATHSQSFDSMHYTHFTDCFQAMSEALSFGT